MVDLSLIVNTIAAAGAILAVWTALYIHWDSSSPDVHAYLESDADKGCSSLVVRNYGTKPAYDVKVIGFNFDFVQPTLLSKVKGSFVTKGIPMLAPGQMRKTIITENRYASEHFADACIQGKVTFKKKSFFRRRKIATSYALDYYSFANSLYTTSDIHEMKVSLEKIRKSLNEISKQLSS